MSRARLGVHIDPMDLIPHGQLRHRPAYAVNSIEDFDRRYSRPGGERGMGQRIIDAAERDWLDRTGRPVDYSDPGQVAEFTRLVEVLRKRLGWPAWSSLSGAGAANEPSADTSEPA